MSVLFPSLLLASNQNLSQNEDESFMIFFPFLTLKYNKVNYKSKNIFPVVYFFENIQKTILIKDFNSEDASGYGGNKVPKLEFLLRDYFEKKISEGYECIVTFGGMGSNHFLATAYWCNQCNISCIVSLETQVDSQYVSKNKELMQKYGATIIENKTEAELFEIIKEYGKPYVIPLGGSSPVGIYGFFIESLYIFDELSKMKASDIPSLIFLTVGTGGSFVGLIFAYRIFLRLVQEGKIKLSSQIIEKLENIKIVGVPVSDRKKEQYLEEIRIKATEFKKYLLCLNDYFSCIEIDKIEEYFLLDFSVGDLPYGVTSEVIQSTIENVKDQTDLILDPVYTGKAWAAMLHYISKEEMSNNPWLFLNTFSGKSYQNENFIKNN
jgi:D-cysteine desulfhydrase